MFSPDFLKIHGFGVTLSKDGQHAKTLEGISELCEFIVRDKHSRTLAR